MSTARPAVAIVGAGGLGTAFAAALSRTRKAKVTIASRPVPRIAEAIVGADIVLLAVPDRAIAPLARTLAPLRSSWRGVVVLHAAGAYGPELLAPLSSRGAATGVLHPLAVLRVRQPDALAGASARIEGDAPARAAARSLCRLVGLVPLAPTRALTPQGRHGYHAAASLVSNDLVALLAAGRDLLVRQGLGKRAATDALTTLAERTLRAVRSSGLSGALTGPVVRNDRATLAAQLTALAVLDEAAGSAHRALSLRLIDLAHASGRLDGKAARSLRRLLARGLRRPRTV